MRNVPNVRANRHRVRTGPLASHDGLGNNGAYQVPAGPHVLTCVVGDGGGWDHVSVHVAGQDRCPTWEEMCYVKRLFFRQDEWVVQYHPAESDYVNAHPTTLHLWRPQTSGEAEAVARQWAQAGEKPLPGALPGPLPLPPQEFV